MIPLLYRAWQRVMSIRCRSETCAQSCGNGEFMKKHEPGITFRSMGVLLLLLLLTVMLKQYSEVILCLPALAEHTLPLPSVWVFLGFLAVYGLVKRFADYRLLSRAEMLCVLYALLIAGPIMTQGVWHRLLSITATIPKTGDFAKIDALSDRMWPHGPNLLDGTLTEGGISDSSGVVWENRDVSKGRETVVPVLKSVGSGAFLRIALPVGGPGIRARVSYLISVLVHATDLGPGSQYYCRAYLDPSDPAAFTELFSGMEGAAASFLFPSGFQRRGMYNINFMPAGDRVFIEFGLKGTGTVVFADPKLMDVSALELAYTGRRIIRAGDAAALTADELEGTVIRPDSMLSLAGLRFILEGYIPFRHWFPTILSWTVLIALLLTATFALAVLMRRQWVDNERFPLPMATIASALVGKDGETPIWKNRTMWAGLAVSLLWCLARGWNFYNPRVPDLNISVPMGPYFAQSQFSPMWNGVTFSVHAIFLSLAIYMELGVLMSIVVGYLLYRALFWVGALTGIASNAGYPFRYEQHFGGYLMYALLIFVFTRKYWMRLIRAALRNDVTASEDEAFSYRTAFGLLALCIAGSAAWAWWIGIGVAGIIVFFVFMVLTGLVSAKIRAECGTPYGYFTPYNGVLILSLLGGMTVFGVDTVLMSMLCSFMVFTGSFYLIPGAQVELLEMGRERRVVPRHLFYAMLAGVFGGMLVGGWVFLSNAYALGGDNMKYEWAFETKPWYLFGMNTDLAAAARQVAGQETAAAAGIMPATWASIYAAGGTLLLSILRKLFAGFWLHPLGFVLGSSHFAEGVWGSCLAAWGIRLTVLKIGGAATVRMRLRPFFIGFFIGAAVAQLLMTIHAGILATEGIENVYRAIL